MKQSTIVVNGGWVNHCGALWALSNFAFWTSKIEHCLRSQICLTSANINQVQAGVNTTNTSNEWQWRHQSQNHNTSVFWNACLNNTLFEVLVVHSSPNSAQQLPLSTSYFVLWWRVVILISVSGILSFSFFPTRCDRLRQNSLLPPSFSARSQGHQPEKSNWCQRCKKLV